MKRNFYFLSMLLTVFTLVLFTYNEIEAVDNSLNKIKEKGKIVVGLDDSFPPMGFRDEKGEIVGFDIEMARELANRMGVEIEFKPVEWDGIVLSLKNKIIDVIWNGLTITEQRLKQIDFSKPYLNNRQIIIVKKGSKIKEKKDLMGKIIGLQLGSSSEIALNREKEILDSLKEIKKYANNTEALMDLKFGRVEAVVVDEVVGRYYINKLPGVYFVLEEDLGRESYGVGVRKGDISFKEEVDRILVEMKEDGTGTAISKKWFGEDILN